MAYFGTLSIPKDPTDIRIYVINWAPWLTKVGTTISSSSWNVPTGLTNLLVANTTTTTSVKISGGVNLSEYTVSNTVITANGETRTVSFTLRVLAQ